jgi:hypothetical protein
MSNGPKLMMTQGLQINQRLDLRLAPLMTPLVRRSREERPVHGDEDDTPWRDPAVRRERG